MAVLEVEVRAAGVLQGLRKGETKARYAIVNALNGTIKAVQRAEKEDVTARFTVRKRDFLLRQAAVIKGATGGSGFANVAGGRFEARVAVGQKPRLLLGQFEVGGPRQPFKGRRAAVPLIGGPARPSFRAEVPGSFTYRALRLRRVRAGRSGAAQGRPSGKPRLRGLQRTFVLEATARQPQGGVFQRTGSGRGDVRLVYPFVAGEQLPRRLRFLPIARRVAAREMPVRLRAEIRASFRHAALRVFRGLGR